MRTQTVYGSGIQILSFTQEDTATFGTVVEPAPFMSLTPEPEKSGSMVQGVEQVVPGLYDSTPDADNSDGVAVVSGGMDSTTLVYSLIDQGYTPHLVSFDYGQRHKKELQFALATAERLKLRWSLVDLSSITDLIDSSALTHGAEIPDGHYSEETMKITVVPNRNMVMISIAAAMVVNYQYAYIATGMHQGDHEIYPDCRPEFIHDMSRAIKDGNKGFLHHEFQMLTPFIYRTKNSIAEVAYDLDVPLHLTWSCYRGEDIHCGRCSTCVERLEAVHSVTEAPRGWDRTEYADTEYWRQAIAEYESRCTTRNY